MSLAEDIVASLTSTALGSSLRVVGRTTSTMDDLTRWADEGAPDGAVLIADEQTAGRGRMGRSWVAPPGTALLMSVLFRPQLPHDRLGQVPMAVGLGVWEALTAQLGDSALVELKWPNDVLAAGAKVAGLLSEAALASEGPRVIVGVGVNVHQRADQLPPGATSVALLASRTSSETDAAGPAHVTESGTLHVGKPTRAALAAAILSAADRHYLDLLAGADLVPRWARRLGTLGREVQAHTASGTVNGRAVRVTGEGALVLLTDDGREHVLRAGDVSLTGDVA